MALQNPRSGGVPMDDSLETLIGRAERFLQATPTRHLKDAVTILLAQYYRGAPIPFLALLEGKAAMSEPLVEIPPGIEFTERKKLRASLANRYEKSGDLYLVDYHFTTPGGSFGGSLRVKKQPDEISYELNVSGANGELIARIGNAEQRHRYLFPQQHNGRPNLSARLYTIPMTAQLESATVIGVLQPENDLLDLFGKQHPCVPGKPHLVLLQHDLLLAEELEQRLVKPQNESRSPLPEEDPHAEQIRREVERHYRGPQRRSFRTPQNPAIRKPRVVPELPEPITVSAPVVEQPVPAVSAPVSAPVAIPLSAPSPEPDVQTLPQDRYELAVRAIENSALKNGHRMTELHLRTIDALLLSRPERQVILLEGKKESELRAQRHRKNQNEYWLSVLGKERYLRTLADDKTTDDPVKVTTRITGGERCAIDLMLPAGTYRTSEQIRSLFPFPRFLDPKVNDARSAAEYTERSGVGMLRIGPDGRVRIFGKAYNFTTEYADEPLLFVFNDQDLLFYSLKGEELSSLVGGRHEAALRSLSKSASVLERKIQGFDFAENERLALKELIDGWVAHPERYASPGLTLSVQGEIASKPLFRGRAGFRHYVDGAIRHSIHVGPFPEVRLAWTGPYVGAYLPGQDDPCAIIELETRGVVRKPSRFDTLDGHLVRNISQNGHYNNFMLDQLFFSFAGDDLKRIPGWERGAYLIEKHEERMRFSFLTRNGDIAVTHPLLPLSVIEKGERIAQVVDPETSWITLVR